MDDSELLSLYDDHAAALVTIGTERFSLDRHIAAELAFEVCIGSIRHSRAIKDARKWLAAAMVYASRAYVRSHERGGEIP